MSAHRSSTDEHSNPDPFEQYIIDAIPKALGERRVPFNDRRMLLMWGVIVLLFALLFTWFVRAEEDRSAFERQIVANCLSFDNFISTIQAATATSKQLTPAEKRDRIKLYEQAKQTCPP